MRNPRSIYWRAAVTLFVVFSFIIIAATGIILFITPPGRVANWTLWKLFFLTKSQWQSVHTIFSFLFVIAAVFHIIFNWKVIVTYLTSRIQEHLRMKKEIALSASVALLILVVTISGLPPSATVMEFGESIKNSWSTGQTEPPMPHAEAMTVNELAAKMKFPPGQLEENLRNAGISLADEHMTIGEIAEANNISPMELYRKGKIAAKSGVFSGGGGAGRKTIAQIAEEQGIPLADAIARLAGNGIKADGDAMLREVANTHNVTPMGLVTIMTGGAAASDRGVR